MATVETGFPSELLWEEESCNMSLGTVEAVEAGCIAAVPSVPARNQKPGLASVGMDWVVAAGAHHGGEGSCSCRTLSRAPLGQGLTKARLCVLPPDTLLSD